MVTNIEHVIATPITSPGVATMSHTNQPRAQTRRTPLGESTVRINNAHQGYAYSPEKPSMSLPHHESRRPDGQLPIHDQAPDSPSSPHNRQLLSPSPGSNAPHKRLSAISKESQAENPNRNSQISTTSTNASDGKRRKTHIGPWHLGKTLGKGATARVRMARHAITGQPAAIKIVQKRNAQLSQAGSLASLDRMDAKFVDSGDGFRRMPYSIEREVAIMKLIDHPHIMKLYDIWENRTEIYLVLEYVDDGELFEYISKHECLPEDEAMRCFRQILSAVGYCHEFRICHRDLKPENILLNREGDIKIADFGMAALQQSPEHRLQTSCGSPHYAAPEVIRGVPYRGDKVDIWSMGVILYAALSGRLPFDSPSIPVLLEMIKKGQYRMPSAISPEAADLIHRMLQVDHRDRVNIRQIWRHPLLRKYDHLDDFGGGMNPRLPDIHECGRPVLRRSDIDRELLRHLRAMWHQSEENQLVDQLLSEQPNDQKLFYSLLLKHRERQLENYIPDVGHSKSDYHHSRPLGQVKMLSTRQFVQPSTKGHGRQVSRFTVVSNVSRGRHTRDGSGYAETDAAETVQSYDPYRPSRPQNRFQPAPGARANVIVHGHRQSQQDIVDPRNLLASRSSDAGDSHELRNSGTTSSAGRTRHASLAPPSRPFTSRSSLASSTRSRVSGSNVRVLRKRGVSFSHPRRSSISKQRGLSDDHDVNVEAPALERHSKYTEVTDDGSDAIRAVTSPPNSSRYIRSRKGTSPGSQLLLSAQKPDRVSKLWNEDVRQLSSSLAKDCDEAFNRTSVRSSMASRVDGFDPSRDPQYDERASSMGSINVPIASSPCLPRHLDIPISRNKPERSSWDSRPLPPPPTRSESMNIELAEARRLAQLRKASGDTDESVGYLDRMVSHIDRLLLPGSSPDRRVVSAPAKPRGHEAGKHLPSIYETEGDSGLSARLNDFETFIHKQEVRESVSTRVTSAPESRAIGGSSWHQSDGRTSRRGDRNSVSIRVVQSSSPSPAKPPAPLNIRKQSSRGSDPPNRMASGNQAFLEHDLRQEYANGSGLNSAKFGNFSRDSEEDIHNHETSNGTLRKKKPYWFKRTSKSGNESNTQYQVDRAGTVRTQSSSNDTSHQSSDPTLPEIVGKKKSFRLGRLFKRKSSKDVTGFEIFDDEASLAASVEDQRHTDIGRVVENPRARQIEPQQNWLARLFNVKPAMKFMCFSVSKRRARQEVVTLLREWKKYGTRDIVVDKERNIVFGKVGAKNYLNMKEVAFASEIMTVIEHGKRSHLSIARFTQEKGAASSFFKVVETLETVLKSRGMLVSDERKKSMMIKTLNCS